MDAAEKKKKAGSQTIETDSSGKRGQIYFPDGIKIRKLGIDPYFSSLTWKKGTDLFIKYKKADNKGCRKQKTLIYDLQNVLTRSPEIVAFSQLLPSLGLQSK
jgi:hypothetical protein